MKVNRKLILSIVLTTIMMGTGFNQVFLKTSVERTSPTTIEGRGYY